MNKVLMLSAIIVGIVFLVIAGVYFIEPAKSLPHFFPGYDGSLTKPHFKHGIVALGIAFVAFAFVWFESGKGRKKPQESPEQKVN